MMSSILSAIVLSFALCAVLTWVAIPFLRKLNFGQSIRKEGPQGHKKKSGTPTMGGIVIIFSVIIATLFCVNFYGNKFSYSILNSKEVSNAFLAIFLFLAYGLIGFADDYIKVVMKRNLGLTSKQKLLGQAVVAFLFLFWTSGNTNLWLPLININIDFGIFYYLLAFCLLIGTTNAVNLTDGLDGLAAGATIPVAVAYLFIALSLGFNTLGVFSASIIGVCAGFLIFNFNPAKVFMGDTGSLALGGGIAALALLTKTEILLIIIGGLYVVEAASVILQVVSFKSTGKRIFKMSPIHHHFELSGWSERKVVLVFWMVSGIFSLVGYGLWLMQYSRGVGNV